MMQIDLNDLREEHLHALLGTAENFRIEFKSELHLDSPAQRLEAAKDISALANSAGGRIFYGINEGKKSDEPGRAERLTPLTDPSLKSKLEDVVADTVHPRPHWRIVSVEIEGGHVLVAEVYPSLGRDLHMVSGDRFYRRAEARTIKMTEPEIREAYNRISISSLSLEQALVTKVREQEELVTNYYQSVMIVPWYARHGLMDPRALRDIGKDLVDGPFKEYRTPNSEYWNALRNIQAYADGLRAHVSGVFDLFVTRAGIVHLSDKAIITKPEPRYYIMAVGLMENILVALRSARLILDRCHYWGPVHVVQVLRVPENASVVMARNSVYHNELARGRYEQVVPEVNLTELGQNIEPIARDLCDQLFQALGAISCPFFNEDGSMRDEVRKWARL
ncbi:MAG TPA: ATP-binding protein [Thermoanaerobaculia bacterium]|nr:ATP-binding protein [Thermoanaerobaculia bacterium]